MESKVLNFPDAMKVAELISPHIDKKSLATMSSGDFISALLETIPPLDYIKLMSLILNLPMHEINNRDGKFLLDSLLAWMGVTPIEKLLDVYAQMGNK